MRAVLLVLAGFVLMEPVTYAVHRWVMHGPGRRVHASHHRSRSTPGLELNDLYPVGVACVVMIAMAAGFNLPGFAPLVWIAVGITAYGLAYAAVHDVYIHGRLPLFRGRRFRVLDQLAEAHRMHHVFGREPYGMLLPIVVTTSASQRSRDRSRLPVDPTR
jgi:beta-carotene 3-hydroxylase